jgi:two-component system, OmpR family, response regulator CpxR
MSRRLLLIDDDIELAGLMRDFFTEHGFQLEACQDGPAGLRRLRETSFDLVLLDVMLPTRTGFSILEELRRSSNVPVLMLTAVTDRASRIAGLQGGADDYLPKPFDPVELLARVNAILRRAQPAPARGDGCLELLGIRLMPGTRTVTQAGVAVPLTMAEYGILETLMRHAGSVVTRDQITQCMYQRDSTPFDRWIDVHISRLRKKLEGGAGLIKTVRGCGYQFCRGEDVAA